MNKHFVFIILASCFILLTLAGVAAAEDHSDRVCIYKNENFHGHEQCYRPGDEVSDLKHAEIGSIRVYGHARAMLYEDRDFNGRSIDFSTDVADIKRLPRSGSKDWHDHIGSMKVTSDTAFNGVEKLYTPDFLYQRSKPFGILGLVNEGACVYEKPNFEGRSQCWATGTDISDLSFANWKDKISSVRVFGDGKLVGYENKDFHGDRVLIDHDVSDLSGMPMGVSGNWNHEMSSLQVQ